MVVDGMGVAEADILNKALNIIDDAESEGITLRLLGALAIRYQCKDYLYIHRLLKRVLTDIDFMGLSSQRPAIRRFMEGKGYILRKDLLLFEDRFFFIDPESGLKIDIFLDRLKMNHTIDLRRRLGIDRYTLSISDLVLEKLQIVKINEKDIIDLILLFRAKKLSRDESGINVSYIVDILRDDWGFYYTVTMNLEKVLRYVDTYDALNDEDKAVVKENISSLLEAIETAPKTLRWRLRSKIGTKVPWYTEVEEVER
jgi:hypothetical protein